MGESRASAGSGIRLELPFIEKAAYAYYVHNLLARIPTILACSTSTSALIFELKMKLNGKRLGRISTH